jgi:SNF2 family DNA or RNA helicase
MGKNRGQWQHSKGADEGQPFVTATTTAVKTTDYHAKFYANQLSRRFTGDTPDKLASSLVDALVDLNPHQIDAALFAFQSPLSHGVILADEVGLGKTIEAGLVISQFWAERKRRILVITPANLDLRGRLIPLVQLPRNPR